MKVKDVIQTIDALTCRAAEGTVDTLKAGNPENEVHGIASAFIASVHVLQCAVRDGADLLITHEPTFFNHFDRVEDLRDNGVYQAKKRLIEENGLTVFRLHDRLHQTRPDIILRGMAAAIGWSRYSDESEDHIFHLPPTSLKNLEKHLKNTLDYPLRQVIGRPDMPCKTIGLLPGAVGGDAQLRFMLRHDVDVLLCGETAEWQIYEYIRDSCALGIPRGLIVLGHANSEEMGMKYFTELLKPALPDIPVRFIPAGDPARFF